jgi:hypothetical protein
MGNPLLGMLTKGQDKDKASKESAFRQNPDNDISRIKILTFNSIWR